MNGGEGVYSRLGEVRKKAANDKLYDHIRSSEEGRVDETVNRKYQRYVILQQGDDATTTVATLNRLNALNQRVGEENVVLVRRTDNDYITEQGDLYTLQGETKINVIGHGDIAGDSPRLGGRTAADIVADIDTVLLPSRANDQPATATKIELRGCQTRACGRHDKHLAEGVATLWERVRGEETLVKGYTGKIAINQHGKTDHTPTAESVLGKEKEGSGLVKSSENYNRLLKINDERSAAVKNIPDDVEGKRVDRDPNAGEPLRTKYTSIDYDDEERVWRAAFDDNTNTGRGAGNNEFVTTLNLKTGEFSVESAFRRDKEGGYFFSDVARVQLLGMLDKAGKQGYMPRYLVRSNITNENTKAVIARSKDKGEKALLEDFLNNTGNGR